MIISSLYLYDTLNQNIRNVVYKYVCITLTLFFDVLRNCWINEQTILPLLTSTTTFMGYKFNKNWTDILMVHWLLSFHSNIWHSTLLHVFAFKGKPTNHILLLSRFYYVYVILFSVIVRHVMKVWNIYISWKIQHPKILRIIASCKNRNLFYFRFVYKVF